MSLNAKCEILKIPTELRKKLPNKVNFTPDSKSYCFDLRVLLYKKKNMKFIIAVRNTKCRLSSIFVKINYCRL